MEFQGLREITAIVSVTEKTWAGRHVFVTHITECFKSNLYSSASHLTISYNFTVQTMVNMAHVFLEPRENNNMTDGLYPYTLSLSWVPVTRWLIKRQISSFIRTANTISVLECVCWILDESFYDLIFGVQWFVLVFQILFPAVIVCRLHFFFCFFSNAQSVF